MAWILSRCWCTLVFSVLRLKMQFYLHLGKADPWKREAVGTLINKNWNKKPARKETRALRLKRIHTVEQTRTHAILLCLGQRMCWVCVSDTYYTVTNYFKEKYCSYFLYLEPSQSALKIKKKCSWTLEAFGSCSSRIANIKTTGHVVF